MSQEKDVAKALMGKQTCPRRMGDMGPWDREEDLDKWESVGTDRVCSFCGSLHPVDFLRLCTESSHPDGQVNISKGKPGKFYVHRKGIKNATEGGCKFYGIHCPKDMKEDLMKVLVPAVEESWQRMFHKLKE